MRQILLILALSFVTSHVLADTLTVKLDGTGDYLDIHDAVGWSESGDVILIYPGIYYDNVDCYGRDSLTIASLYLLNPVDSIIHNTIINGNKNGTGIVAFRGEQNLRIIGLTITNASPTDYVYSEGKNGGGLYLSGVAVSVEHCIIKENTGDSGGGIAAYASQVFLSGTSICYNHAYSLGGGIRNGGSTIIFDTIDLCNLYLNYSRLGTDYFQSSESPVTPIVLDTGTVMEPDSYYFICQDPGDYTGCDLDISINHPEIQDVSADLYVNPLGNDANSGLSLDVPLKTISFALLKIKSDTLQQNTIHLSNGEYSPSNGNKFPIGLKNSVPVIGEDNENTIIDLDSMTTFCFGNLGQKEMILKNFTIENGNTDSLFSAYSIIYIYGYDYVLIDSIILRNCITKEYSTILSVHGCDSLFIKNSTFEETKSVECVEITGDQYFEHSCYAEMSSCRIIKNYPPDIPYYYNFNSGLTLYSGMEKNYLTVGIINCEITDNRVIRPDSGYVYATAPPGIAIYDHVIATIVNSTIGNNANPNPLTAGLYISSGSEAYLFNTIIYGNESNQIIISNGWDEDSCKVIFNNCLVASGNNGILISNDGNILVGFDSTNLSNNPGWINYGNFPYRLSNGSPCINAGTQNLPAGIVLPSVDLSGNPRISGGEIDIGAYEFNYVGVEEQIPVKTSEYLNLSPNPFHDQLNITLSNPLAGKKIELTLYDIRGNLVATIFDGQLAGTTLTWSPDSKQNQMTPGVYLLKLKADSSITVITKLIKI